jgi:hypothetical protein
MNHHFQTRNGVVRICDDGHLQQRVSRRTDIFPTLLMGLVAFLGSQNIDRAEAATPAVSGQWGRDMLFFEPPSSGPGPVLKAKRQGNRSFAPDLPCCGIVQTWFGDPNNPVLKPEAASAVRKFGELSLQGTVLPDLHSMCRPEPPPFVLALQYGVLVIQQMDEVKFIYLLNNTIRRVRMHSLHPGNLTPSWTGDSIGHYDGDTLVVDTVGITTAPFSTVDAFGTPHGPNMHVIERYHLIDGRTAAEQQARHGAKFTSAPAFARGLIDSDTNLPGLQVEFTVEDPSTFTMPWSGHVTYRGVLGIWPEAVCAENPYAYYSGATTAVPHAEVPDF